MPILKIMLVVLKQYTSQNMLEYRVTMDFFVTGNYE